MIKIYLNKKGFVSIDHKKLEGRAQKVFDLLGIEDKEFELNFVHPKKIRKINKKYRGKDESTTILSFVSADAEGFISSPENSNYLGEVFLCTTEIKKKAKTEQISTENMMTRYLVHGILHLLGYRHDANENLLKMESKEDELLHELTNG
jgi:probable rRNA maturation factor